MTAPLWREMIRQAIDWVHSDEATVAALRAMEAELDDAGPARAHELVAAVAAIDAAALPVEADSLHEMIVEEAAAERARLADLEVRAAYEALPAEEREALAESAREQPEVTDDAPRPALRVGVRMRGPDSIYSPAELAAIKDRSHSVAADSWAPIPGGAILSPPPRPVSVAAPRARAGLGGRRSAGGGRRTRSAGSGGGGGSGDDGSDEPGEPPPPAAEPPAPGVEHHRGTRHNVGRCARWRCLVPRCTRPVAIWGACKRCRRRETGGRP